VLSKVGCNSGACHGAAAGQNGFRLSLRGFDPELDYEQIVREKGGKRIDLAKPGESLLLRKPSGGEPHGGGMGLKIGDGAYRTLLAWIRAGAPAPEEAVRVTDVVVAPGERVLARPGTGQQLLVTAKYSDGTERDVTGWARFSSSDDAVAEAAGE